MIFSVVEDTYSTVAYLNNDLTLINPRAYHWKMSFNPDLKL